MEALPKWEYLTYSVGDVVQGEGAMAWAEVERVMNAWGAQGWELVGVTGNNTHRAFFKRRLAP
jgi:hypothetical protein